MNFFFINYHEICTVNTKHASSDVLFIILVLYVYYFRISPWFYHFLWISLKVEQKINFIKFYIIFLYYLLWNMTVIRKSVRSDVLVYNSDVICLLFLYFFLVLSFLCILLKEKQISMLLYQCKSNMVTICMVYTTIFHLLDSELTFWRSLLKQGENN